MKRVAYGPPGTGKTSHIREAVEALLKGGLVSPTKTYLLSFSRAGAAELAGRIANNVNIGTIHSLCYRMAGLNRGRVIDNRKMLEYAEYSGIDIKLDRIKEDGSTEELTDGEMAYAIYGLARARCENAEAVYNAQKNQPKNAVWFRYYCDTYDKWRATYGYVDFNDMLAMGEEILRDPRNEGQMEIDLLVVDEAQDLSEQQWRVVRLLSQRASNFIIAGDDDQAIYAWAGADPQGMAKFDREFAEERVVLNQSWRLPLTIKTAAENLIMRVEDRVEKPFEAFGGRDGRITIADSVVHSIDDRDTLILYRNHSIRQEFEQDLIDANIPYINHNGRPAPLKSALAALIMELEKVPDLSFVDRSVSWGLDKWWTLQQVRMYQDGKLSLVDFIAKCNQKPEIVYYLLQLMKQGPLSSVKPKVKLSTIHGAKGREAEHVILINSTTSNSLEGWESDRENELRVWYVGMTRAKSELTIVEYENPVELLT